jgi:hypothetical protein
MDLINLFSMLTDQKTLDKFSNQVGANKNQTQKLVNLGLPTIMKAMDRNAGLPSGADSLMKALKRHQNDDVERMVRDLDMVDADDGAKILNHVFSEKKEQVTKNLAKRTALGKDQVSTILNQLAPIVLGALGNVQKEQNVDSVNLSGFLSSSMEKTGQSGMMGLIEQLLDKEKSGSIWDDIIRIITGFFKRKS